MYRYVGHDMSSRIYLISSHKDNVTISQVFNISRGKGYLYHVHTSGHNGTVMMITQWEPNDNVMLLYSLAKAHYN